MVSNLWCRALLPALALVLSPMAICGCSSFDPVEETRFTLLDERTYAGLGIGDARWVAYDDQHSLTFACTNGAAGNHDPDQCSVLYQPSFSWPGPKCLAERAELNEDLKQGDIEEPGPDGVCLQGLLRHVVDCVHPDEQCYQSADGDVSNMWGAGVGLSFSSDGRTGWNPAQHGVRGVAFEFSGSQETKLNLRVEIPTVLDDSTPVPADRPLIRNDGSVIGTDGYVYDCNSKKGPKTAHTRLGDVRVDDELHTLTSQEHPAGSPFWQPTATSAWVASPVSVGQNKFEWGQVLPPPGTKVGTTSYDFDDRRILGVHFQVVHQDPENKSDIPFAFCIRNLAFLLE